MLNFLEARQMVLDSLNPSAPVELPLEETLGLAAAVDIRASEPVPPFTNSAMDGFALRWEDTAQASEGSPVRLRVLGMLPAGEVSGHALEPGTALRIMTGAALPEGADAIVPLERVRCEAEWVEVRMPVRCGANIRRAGEDIPESGLVLAAGTALRPGEIGVLASTGFARIQVHPRPRVAVLTTGDELVDCSERPGPGRIRDANIHALCAQIAACGAIPAPYPRVPDGRLALEAVLQQALGTCDVVLTTGGVSVGDCDFVKPALEALGAEPRFWRVAQKPGGPLGFWTAEGKPVFGIPGNPVAAMLMVEEYVRPALRRLMGFRHLHRPERKGLLDQAWRRSGPDGRLHFLRVVAREVDGHWRATLTGPQGSGILSSMLKANALALVPADVTEVGPGGEVLLHLTEWAEDH
jgi:molybdopterin molybdotransferase